MITIQRKVREGEWHGTRHAGEGERGGVSWHHEKKPRSGRIARRGAIVTIQWKKSCGEVSVQSKSFQYFRGCTCRLPKILRTRILNFQATSNGIAGSLPDAR